ncbi:PP2C family protein-serine/threonine phosphatase [Marinobacter sp. F3R08]|uniref:PP2C family protein-serine/threonine phosphatase n=1 Tax=Marinobacter sp. F3R08 TaxID=2841559 RepID=UPI001C09C00D|nr:SpoIIE family protein phosphatase [Marinobacter sp. F3R08]MBU2955895.1 SpoIIE family protein phosphatase [Marinobacter sp. F3R08]
MWNQQQIEDDQERQSTVLVVEDSISERVRLIAMLGKLDYRVIEAVNGLEALAYLEKEHVDIVISDWRMPGMNGFELCKQVKATADLAPYFILLTGQKTVHDLVAAMDAGADDFIAKPFAVEELRVRMNAGRRVINLRHRLCEKNQQLRLSLARESETLVQLKDDLMAAETLQRALLPDPTSLPDGITMLHYFKGASGVAGDAYNVIALSPTMIAFYLIDVSGHGIRSAMLSFYATQLLSNTSKPVNGSDLPPVPSQVAQELNQRFLAEFDDGDYLTMVYGILNLENGQGCFCQAGHPNPFVLGSESGAPAILGGPGFPIGMLAEATYEDVPFELKPGQRLIVTSDGLFSCRMKSGNLLTKEHLAGLLNRIAQLPSAHQQTKLSSTLDSFIAAQELEDDISAMMIERALEPATPACPSTPSECVPA